MSSEPDVIRAHVSLMVLAVVGVLMTSLAARSESAPAPDSTKAPFVRLAVLAFDDIRVVTDSTKLLAHHAVLSPEGLQLDLTSDGAFSSNLYSSPQLRLVPWEKIESIHVRKGSSGTGPLVGAVLGLAIGTAIYFSQVGASPWLYSSVSGAPIAVGLVGGATLGWLVDRPGLWKTVYP